MISVIVPVYNVEKYLHRCVDSILAQTFADFELLLVNDGSKDKSGAICDEYAAKDSRVRVFHKENGGVSSARNLGFDNAIGEWITFVDSDDYILNDGLEKLVSSINNDVDIVVGDYFKDVRYERAEFVNAVLRNNITWSLWGKLFKRTVLNASSFDTPRYYNIGEDLIMQLKVGYNVNYVKCIKGNVYAVCENPNSATQTRVRSLEYEINFCEYVHTIVQRYKFDYKESYWILRMESLFGLVSNGVRVPYGLDWVKQIKKDGENFNQSIRDRILLNVSWNGLCNILLKLKQFVWKMSKG